jgi:hypothetical protein
MSTALVIVWVLLGIAWWGTLFFHWKALRDGKRLQAEIRKRLVVLDEAIAKDFPRTSAEVVMREIERRQQRGAR